MDTKSFTCIETHTHLYSIYTIIHSGYNPLITQFGLNGDGRDRVTVYRYSYRYGRLNIHCRSSNHTHAPANWYFANGTRIGVRDRNFRAGHFSNGTAMLQIAHFRPLSYCDGGNFTCVVNASADHYETKNFSLLIGCKC